MCLAVASSSAVAACGDDGDDDGLGNGGRSQAEGGASGSRATGGAAPTGKGGGSGMEEAGTGGREAVEPGAPCTENCPKGNVESCFDACPLGACDNAEFFASTPCSSLYPTPVDDETVWCAKGMSSKYCVTVINADIDNYVVTCGDGVPQFEQCDHGCGTINNVASCNK